MKKVVSVILVMSMLFMLATPTEAAATRMTAQPTATAVSSISTMSNPGIGFTWSPILTRTMYGVGFTFNRVQPTTIRVELQNVATGAIIASFSETFTSSSAIAFARPRNTPPGTYRILVTMNQPHGVMFMASDPIVLR